MKEKKFHRIAPFVPVRNLRETLDFYRDQFGFYEEWTFGEIDGGIRRDNMRIVFCEDPDYIKEINNNVYRFTLIWFVDNVDEIYAEFNQRKIEIASELENKPWGIREFSIHDINGYLIRVSEGIS
jgi:uncharacterized glyoxalase superfamily protein PhnB